MFVIHPRTFVRSHASKQIARILIATTLVGNFACGVKNNAKSENENRKPSGALPILSEKDRKKVLLEVGSRKVTVGEFLDLLNAQSPYLRARYQSPERRREFFENLIQFELLAEEAHRRGLDQDKEVLRIAQDAMIAEMIEKDIEGEIKMKDISEADVEKYYNEKKNTYEFYKPPQVRISHILAKDKTQADKVLTMAIASRKSTDDLAAFESIVDKYSEDKTSAPVHGDLNYFEKPVHGEQQSPLGVKIPKELALTAFEMRDIGDVYPQAIKTEQGFHIIKLTGKRDAMTMTLDEARQPIRNRIWKERRDNKLKELITRLRKKAHIEEFPEAVAKTPIEP